MELGDGALVADSSSSSSSAGVTNDGGFSFNPLDAFDDIMNTDNVESFEDNLDLSFDTVAAFAFSGDHADYDGDDGEDADDGDESSSDGHVDREYDAGRERWWTRDGPLLPVVGAFCACAL